MHREQSELVKARQSELRSIIEEEVSSDPCPVNSTETSALPVRLPAGAMEIVEPVSKNADMDRSRTLEPTQEASLPNLGSGSIPMTKTVSKAEANANIEQTASHSENEQLPPAALDRHTTDVTVTAGLAVVDHAPPANAEGTCHDAPGGGSRDEELLTRAENGAIEACVNDATATAGQIALTMQTRLEGNPSQSAEREVVEEITITEAANQSLESSMSGKIQGNIGLMHTPSVPHCSDTHSPCIDPVPLNVTLQLD